MQYYNKKYLNWAMREYANMKFTVSPLPQLAKLLEKDFKGTISKNGINILLDRLEIPFENVRLFSGLKRDIQEKADSYKYRLGHKFIVVWGNGRFIIKIY